MDRLGPDSLPCIKLIGQKKPQICWYSFAFIIFFHILGFYGAYLVFNGFAKWETCLWTLFYGFWCTFGLHAGAHRYWSHKSFKATFPLEILMAFFQMASLQYSIYHWAQHHRVHHKYLDTNADPYNAKRGFFFSHIGWLIYHHEDDYLQKRDKIYMADLQNDPLVMFQHKYYYHLLILPTLIIPGWVSWYFWNESVLISWLVVGQLRMLLTTHASASVNSFAHLFGDRPYTKTMTPSENQIVSFFTMGDGWHNYHHTFPWDYKGSEYGRLNVSASILRFFASIGWAYNLKTVSHESIRSRMAKNLENENTRNGRGPWGWGDEESPNKDKNDTIVQYQKNSVKYTTN